MNMRYLMILLCYVSLELGMDNDDDLSEDDRRHLSDTTSVTMNNSPLKSSSKTKQARRVASSKSDFEDEEEGDAKDGSPVELLHSGGVLGDLPALSPAKKDATGSTTKKKKKKQNMISRQGDLPADIPQEFVCELCQKQMTDPVKSIYGNVFERGVIDNWLKTQGRICPLTGAPLSDTDLTPMDELKTRIRKWILQRSINADDAPVLSTPTADPSPSRIAPDKSGKIPHGGSRASDDDGLYDF